MKSVTVYFLAVLAAVNAMPAMSGGSNLVERQAAQQQTTSNDLKNGACMPVTFIMARGSTETGNMGQIPGPPTCAGLKQKMQNQVACQGVGSEDGYAAALQPNFMPKNTDDQSIAGATKIINMAATKCPQSTIIIGGYSQGSAVMDNAIQGLPANVHSKVAGVVLFGYTRNAQDNAQVPGYPKAQTKIFCAQGDQVCDNTLTISQAHLSYAANADEASTFLVGMAKQAMSSGKGATGAAAAPQAAPAGNSTKDAVAKMAQEFASAKIARGMEAA